MATFKTVKQLFVTPNVGNIEPNTVYYVRAGEGFDLYCTDSTGNAVYQINKTEEKVAYPSGLIVDNSINGSNLTTFVPLNNNIKFFPFIPKFNLRASSIRINVTTAGAGTIALYLLESDDLAVPQRLLFKIPSTSLSLTVAGVKTNSTVQGKISNGVFSSDAVSGSIFKANKLYWWGVFTSGTAPRFVGVPQASLLPLGTTGVAGASIQTAYSVNVTGEPNDITNINSLGTVTLVNSIAPSIQFNTTDF